MAKNHLVILESPSKINAIKSYLGSSYKVMASIGHVRDLPKSSLGIDIENNFEAHYINIRGKGDIIKNLAKEAKAADIVYLATDPDREGEAISWHLANALKLPPEKTKRITFNEISKNVVKAAVKAPRDIDMDLVNSQQARRILDRIVGYKLSPYLWKTVKSGLSAGRVQSAATKIIVEREQQIRDFVPQEYWTINAVFGCDGEKTFSAKFYGTSKKIEPRSKAEVDEILSALGNEYVVKSVKNSLKSRTPAPPFITSTLQQEAYRKLGFQSHKTMKIAQELYEGINVGSGTHGLITYMRTDSLRISDGAAMMAKDYICSVFGDEYYNGKPRQFKTASGAQDAHEAIRPVSTEFAPDKIKKSLTSDQYKLYSLIFDRFIACQMSPALYDTVAVDIMNGEYVFKANGSILKFKGFLALYEEGVDGTGEKYDKAVLPVLNEDMVIKLKELQPSQHFTEPPPRFSEGSLIKFLEEKRLGRPSTYATIINTIITRNYVKREGKTLVPTELGNITTELICKHFPEITDYQFTAQMEDSLDSIETGNVDMKEVLSKFYEKFAAELENALTSAESVKVEVPSEVTDIICDKCGAAMIIKNGRFGKFAACPNYPACKNTQKLTADGKAEKQEKEEPVMTDLICDKCGANMLLRKGRYGEFYACSEFPKCNNTIAKDEKLGVSCPECQSGEILIRRGKKRVFYSCSKYPDCKFSSWDIPTNEKCPDCGGVLYLKKAKSQLICKNTNCGYKAVKETK